MKSRWLFKIKAAYDDDDDDRDDDDDNVRGVVTGASWKARADVAPTATSTAADDILMVLDTNCWFLLCSTVPFRRELFGWSL